ncbi:hypothetical protein [Psychroserpens mesophilus]|uniref:hypothetical protein n=1 Tax=Psychroserpens mesophilus TaxID=325473 RepID=UPI00058E204E|nr:hypothetical protein [Psychroserpens mesophilus]
MKLLKNFKVLKASSIVETIIAIVLISICSLVALSVYINVISQNSPVHYYEAKHKVEQLTHLAIKNQDYENDIFKYNHYTITKNAIIKADEQIVVLDYTITTGNKKYNIIKLVKFEKGN